MALQVHTAARADAFVRPLAELLAAPVADPLAPEVMGIPTRGMERWLSQQLAQALGAPPAGRDGICANVEFRFLGGPVGQALAVPGTDPDDDPWRPDRAVWTLIDAVEELRGAAWPDHLVSHIALDGSEDPDGVRRGRRDGVLRHVANLFDRYAMHRPDKVRAWAAGRLEDGQGAPVRGIDLATAARGEGPVGWAAVGSWRPVDAASRAGDAPAALAAAGAFRVLARTAAVRAASRPGPPGLSAGSAARSTGPRRHRNGTSGVRRWSPKMTPGSGRSTAIRVSW
jgi:hypothetical protein